MRQQWHGFPASISPRSGISAALFSGLHLLVVWNFAVAQPLFDLFSRTAEFFVVRQSPPLDIILFAVLLSVGLFRLWAFSSSGDSVSFIQGSARRAASAAGRVFIRAVGPASPADLTRFAVRLRNGPASGSRRDRASRRASVYHLLSSVRTFCTLLSPGIALFPTLFLFFSPVSTLLFSSPVDVAQVKIKDPPPIVLVIFDEFSSISLMDENRQIDAQRYPHFAAFAEEATWFRNASSMSAHTVWAIPAILTGQLSQP